MIHLQFLRWIGATLLVAVLPAAEHAQSVDFLLVADWGADEVLRYDAMTGEFIDTFLPKHSGGLNQPYGILIGPDVSGDDRPDLYVSTGTFGGPGQLKSVLRFDGVTGAFIDDFATGGALKSPRGLIFGLDGNLYVADRAYPLSQGRVARYDGDTGAYIDDFVPLTPGTPKGIIFGPSVEDPDRLDLYVGFGGGSGGNRVLRFNGTTGVFLGEFVSAGSGGLVNPSGLVFGPDGNLYVSSASFADDTSAILRFQGPAGGNPGAFLDAFVPPGSGGLAVPSGLLFGPDANSDDTHDLYVTSSEFNGSSINGKNARITRYDGTTGAPIDTLVPARSGGLDDAVFMTFSQSDPVTLAYFGAATQFMATRTIPEPSTAALLTLAFALLHYRRAADRTVSRRGRSQSTFAVH